MIILYVSEDAVSFHIEITFSSRAKLYNPTDPGKSCSERVDMEGRVAERACLMADGIMEL